MTRHNAASAANGQRGGRPPKGTRIETGAAVLLSHVAPDGMTDLGRGKVSEIRKIGASRILIIPVGDGEIRILIV